MKRFLIGLTVFLFLVFAILGAGLLFFLNRFDPNDYRDLLQSKLSESLQCQVKLGELFVVWEGGLGIRIEGVTLQKKEREIPFFEVKTILAQVNPFNLLRQGLILCELRLIRPSVVVVNQGGGGNWSLPSSKGLPKNQSLPWIGKIAVFLTEARIEEGNWHYRDETQRPALDIGIDQITAELKQVLAAGLIKFEGRGRLAGNPQDILKWVGEFHPGAKKSGFEVIFREGRVRLKGEASTDHRQTALRGDFEVRDLDLQSLPFAEINERLPIAGGLNGRFTFSATGSTVDEMRNSLKGTGGFKIRDGAFLNLNLVDSVLQRITPLPALNALLVEVIPGPFQAVLRNPHTPFEALEGEAQIENQRILVRPLQLRNDHFLMQAEGIASFQGDLDFSAQLVLREELSAYLMGRVSELSLLSDAEKQIAIPFLYRGRWPEARPRPDLAYIGKKLIASQGRRLMELVKSQILGEPEGEGTS